MSSAESSQIGHESSGHFSRKLRFRTIDLVDPLTTRGRSRRPASTDSRPTTACFLSPSQKSVVDTPSKPYSTHRQVVVTMSSDQHQLASTSRTSDNHDQAATERIRELEAALSQAEARLEEAEQNLSDDRSLTRIVASKSISDSIVAPPPFLGKLSEQDPMDWLDYFEKFCAFKKLGDKDKTELFAMMLRGNAGDWLNTHFENWETAPTFKELKKAFKATYFRSPELRWKDASALWGQTQGENERVDDYVIRMRKLAHRLKFPDDVLHMAIVNGFRAPIKMHVVQQGVTSLDDSLRSARIAEAAGVAAVDPISTALLDLMKQSLQATEKQAGTLQQLTTKIASLSPAQTNSQINTSSVNQPASRRDFGPRQDRPRPQTIQRYNYAQRSADRRVGNPSLVRNHTITACANCGLQHATGNCAARGQSCRHCNRIGHFARVCRSSRQPSA